MSVGSVHETVVTWGDATLRASLHTILLVVLVLLLQWGLKKWLTPGLRYALWLLVVVRLILPVAPASSWSVFNFFARDAKTQISTPSATEPRLFIPHTASAEPKTETTEASLLPPPREGITLRDAAAWVWLTGLVILLVVVARRYSRMTVSVKAARPVTDAEACSLLEECRVSLRVRPPVRLIETASLSTPAILGVRRPCLLLPVSLLQNLDRSELRLVFLHELMHVRRRDLLLNWLLVTVQAVHWFNPVIWLAFRRLRADREMACDAAVLRHLNAEERQHYGRTLIKLVEQFSPAPLAPGVLSVIHTDTEIKRRILMISKFKPTTRSLTLFSTLLFLLLGLFTLTRAADKSPAPVPTGSPDLKAESARRGEIADRVIKALEDELALHTQAIRDQELKLDALKAELGVSEKEAKGVGESIGDSTLRQLESMRIDARADYERVLTLYSQLTNLSRAELKATVVTVAPDPLLNSLLQKEAELEQKAAEQGVTFDNKSPSLQATRNVQKTIDRQINERLDGILGGLKSRAAAEKKRMESLEMELERFKARDMELDRRHRPYFQLKRDLESLHSIRDSLQTRLWQEKVERSMPNTPVDPRRIRTVDINADGKYLFEGQLLSLDDVTSALKKARAESPDMILSVRVSERAGYATSSALLERCLKLAIVNVSIGKSP